MDAKSVYLTVTMIILANGAMLSAINRDFPVSLRPAAMNWVWATLVVAAGCVTFAVGGWLPRTLSVLVANSCLLQGSAFITGRSERSRSRRQSVSMACLRSWHGGFPVFSGHCSRHAGADRGGFGCLDLADGSQYPAACRQAPP
ncbi:hypothetical protein HGG75_24090 [Ochrobactrum pseudogrignonense]|nr:hypothetical protein [Brucella pseudogrignonensis]